MWKVVKSKEPLIILKEDYTENEFNLIKSVLGLTKNTDKIVLREGLQIEFNEKEA